MSKPQWEPGSPAWYANQNDKIATIPDIFTSEEPAKAVTSFKANKYHPGDKYIWKKGDNIYNVAREMNVSVDWLREFNEIEEGDELEPGVPIYYPSGSRADKRKPIVEVLSTPLQMHVKTPGGAKKWSFGNMRTWADAKGDGFFPADTNLTIVATVKVPIFDDEGEPIEAGYYLDSMALGDYDKTEKLRWTQGYMWSDLEEGHVDSFAKLAPPPKVAEHKIKEQKAKEIAKKSVDIAATQPAKHYLDGFDKAFIEKRLASTLRDGDAHRFKRDYQPLTPHVPCTADIPEGYEDGTDEKGRRFVVIHDYDTKRPDRRLYHNQEVVVSGTFPDSDDGIIYGRPEKAAETGSWYGLDMRLLVADKDLYNDKSDASTRQAEGHRLTWSERFIWVPLAKRSAKTLEKRHRQENKNIIN